MFCFLLGLMHVLAGIGGDLSGNPPQKYDNVDANKESSKPLEASDKTTHDASEHVVVIRETSVV